MGIYKTHVMSNNLEISEKIFSDTNDVTHIPVT